MIQIRVRQLFLIYGAGMLLIGMLAVSEWHSYVRQDSNDSIQTPSWVYQPVPIISHDLWLEPIGNPPEWHLLVDASPLRPK